MNKLEQICQNFILLKSHLDKSDITFLCNHSFRSITGAINGIYKKEYSKNTIDKSNEKDININKSNNNDYLQNLLKNLESSKTKTKAEANANKLTNKTNKKNKNKSQTQTPSIKEVTDDSPTIVNDDENHINKNEDINTHIIKISNNNTIALNEEEDENKDKNQLNDNIPNNISKQNNKKKLYVNIIDKNDKNINVKEIIIKSFSKFGENLTKIVKFVQKMTTVEMFYNELKEKIITVDLVEENIIHIDSIKKITHLFFNILSKIFNYLTKETENICNLCLNNIFDIINLIIDFVKNVKKFIINNNDKVNVTFMKNIKIVGNYCKYVLFIKKYNYEYMIDIQNKKDSNEINKFFKIYTKYLKIVNKLKINLKENDMFVKHFMIQPNMVSFIDLFEMNRKIINYQLNLNFK